jgi:phage tail P2-like protein
MPVKINDFDLISLQTKHMQTDETTKALSAALTPQFKSIVEDVQHCLILGKIDELPEKILDELAWELHIDWYDATADIEIKRALIRNSDKVHMYLGTPFAVEQVVQDYFGDGYVEEWFEYDGNPYMFRVIISNPSVTSELANQFVKAVNAVKNKRSHLEEILVSLSGDMNMYLAGVVHTGDFITVEQVV